jgi:hypothetical protein
VLGALHYGCRFADVRIPNIEFFPTQDISVRVDDAQTGEPIVGAEVTLFLLYVDDPEADVDYSKYAGAPGGFTDTTDAEGLATPLFGYITGCSESWSDIYHCTPYLNDRVTGRPFVVRIVRDDVESFVHGPLSAGDSLSNDAFVVTVIEVGEATLP